MTAQANFSGYNWNGYPVYGEGEDWHDENKSFYHSIQWDALCRHATKLRDGEICQLDPQFTMGGRHVIRIINFEGGSRWIARLRMPGEDEHGPKSLLLQREIDCMELIGERTSIPLPKVFDFDVNVENEIGAPFMLMECLDGNCGSDVKEDRSVPEDHKAKFYAEMARIQTEISSITLPKIGAIIRLADGAYDIGPLPHLGGPFSTAAEYLMAWSKSSQFPFSDDEIEEQCAGSYIKEKVGDHRAYARQVVASIRDFPSRLQALAPNIATRNHGPFPLLHPDFGHQNMVVDDDYNVLGVIDWEHACSVPWEIIQYPFTFQFTPSPMRPSWFYDQSQIVAERKQYFDMVRQAEEHRGWPPMLSTVLGDQAGQDLAMAMKLYVDDGTKGFYCKIFDAHYKRWAEVQDEHAALAPSGDGSEQGEDTAKHPSSLWGILSA